MPNKTSPAKKRKTSRAKAKKPKVKLAKNKVALFCGLICSICVLAIGLSVAVNQTGSQAAQNPQSVEKTEAKTAAKPKVNKEPEQKIVQNKSTQKLSSPKKQDVEAKSQPQIKEKPAVASQKKTVSKPKQSEVKIITKEMKENPAVKKLPSGSTSQALSLQTDKKNDAVRISSAPKNPASQIASVTPPSQQDSVQQNLPRNRFNIPPAANGATIVIVIDDAGRSVENTKRYAALPFPITIAVLPKLPQSRACADAVRAAGKEVILHQPMQSMNLNLDPGPGKITADMNSYQIASIIKENLAELGPGVRGMNNHEGSLITANEIKIGVVLEVCAEKGIYFLDSRTTAETKAPQAALERDMQIFEKAGPYLDNDIDRAKMLERMRETLAYANRHGKALVIGHVDKSVKILPDLLAEMYPEMKAAGYRFATPSMLR